MLLDEIGKSIKKMKQLDAIENAAQDAEKKAKNDSDFKNLVEDFSLSMRKLSQATEKLDYTITTDTAGLLVECIEKLDAVIDSGIVDSDALFTARQQINKKVNPALTKEWKTYHQKKTSGSISKLNTIGNLASDPAEIAKIRSDISNGSEWTGLSLSDDGTATRLDLMVNGIETVDKLEESLNLSDEIRNFIVLVTTKRAKISDISSNVIQWIKEENLEDKFVINFRN